MNLTCLFFVCLFVCFFLVFFQNNHPFSFFVLRNNLIIIVVAVAVVLTPLERVFSFTPAEDLLIRGTSII